MILYDSVTNKSTCPCKKFGVDYNLSKNKQQPHSPINTNWMFLTTRKHIFLNYFIYTWMCWDNCDRTVIQLRKQYSLLKGIKIQLYIMLGRYKAGENYYD